MEVPEAGDPQTGAAGHEEPLAMEKVSCSFSERRTKKPRLPLSLLGEDAESWAFLGKPSGVRPRRGCKRLCVFHLPGF